MQYMLTGHRENQKLRNINYAFKAVPHSGYVVHAKYANRQTRDNATLPFAHPDTSFFVSVLVVFVSFW